MASSKRFWGRGSLDSVVHALEGNSVAAVDAEARRRQLTHWAVYRVDPHFHSTTQGEHLVCHHDDPYWLAQGVPSASH